MLAVYLGMYLFLLAILWGFFFVARHHTLKFSDFSSNIAPVTNMLFIVLIILSLLGFILIFGLGENTPLIQIDTKQKVSDIYY